MADVPLFGLGHPSNSNPITRDHAKSPRKILLGVDQRQCDLGSVLRGFGSDPEQDDAAGGRKPTTENELTKILVECEKHPSLVVGDTNHLVIGNAWATLGYREHMPTCLSQRFQGRGKFSSARNFMRF